MFAEQGHAAQALGDRVRAASRHRGPWPQISVWHGVPLATTTGGESCGAAGAFFLDVGISSTHHIARFWRLHESLVEMPRAAVPVSAPTQIPTDGRAFVIAGAASEGSRSSAEPSLAEGEERQTRYPLDPNDVIAAAFKAAGLPVPEIPTTPSGATPRVAPNRCAAKHRAASCDGRVADMQQP
jgi:hypothetical protein